MARGTSLIQLLTDLRAEARLSQNPAHNKQKRDEQINLLQRTQDYLWEDFDWPHLKVKRQYPLQAGERYYDFKSDFDTERVNTIEVKWGGRWCPLGYGITQEDYFLWDSDLDRRSWPVRRTQITEQDQWEMWPVPAQSATQSTLEGYLQVTGVRKLNPLVADGDMADIDDRLIVLFAAAEILGGRGSKDGQSKLNMANSRYTRLRGRLTKRKSIRMFGIGHVETRRRPYIGFYKPPISVV